jgi:hypothetical protein
MDASVQPCPDCAGGCSGTYKAIDPHWKCGPQESGYMGSTECYEDEECYIYEWPCQTNWDCSNIIYCQALAVGCGAACGGAICTKAPALIVVCVACIIANVTNPNCTNTCFMVEECYYDAEDEPTCTGEQWDHEGGCLCIAP